MVAPVIESVLGTLGGPELTDSSAVKKRRNLSATRSPSASVAAPPTAGASGFGQARQRSQPGLHGGTLTCSITFKPALPYSPSLRRFVKVESQL